MSPHEAMLAIQELMDGVEWDADTLNGISQTLREAGYPVRDPFDAEPVPTYEVDTWFFLKEDIGPLGGVAASGSLLKLLKNEAFLTLICPDQNFGFTLTIDEARTKLMPVPTVYDSLEADDENGVMDRYTVFPAGELETPKERYNYLGCSIGGSAISVWGEVKHSDVDDFDHLGRKVPVYHLDADTQRHIFNRLKD